MKSKKENVTPMNSQKKEHKHGRNLGITIGSIVILILAAASFIFVPAIADAGASNEIPAVGKYGNQEIKYAYGTYFSQMVQQLAQQYQANGQQIDTSTYYYIFNQAFTATVLNLAITDQVEKSKYIVPTSYVDRTMIPYFSENGVYSAKLFNATPDKDKLELRQNIENSLIYDRYLVDVFGDSNTNTYGLKVSKAEEDFIASMNATQRSFEMVAFNKSNFPQSETVAFGKNNVNLFTKYDLSVITTADESTAKKILSQIEKNQITFEDAISSLSAGLYATSPEGRLTNNYFYQLKTLVTSEDDLTKITSLGIDSLSPVLKTSTGYAIFKCEGEPIMPDFSTSSMIDTVYSYMTSYETSKIEDYFINQANDFAAEVTRTTFDAAAKKYGVEATEVSAFPVNYGNNELLTAVPSTSIAALAGAQTNDAFLETAFTLQSNEISSPIVIQDNVVVIKLNEIVTNNSETESFSFMYPYYATQFDQSIVQAYFMDSDKVKNNVIDVFFKYFLNN